MKKMYVLYGFIEHENGEVLFVCETMEKAEELKADFGEHPFDEIQIKEVDLYV